MKLLTCPQCSSAFRVPPDAIADGGRQVRCSACKHEWLAVPVDLRPDTQETGEVPLEEQEVPDFTAEEKKVTQASSFNDELETEVEKGFHPGDDFADMLMDDPGGDIPLRMDNADIHPFRLLKRRLYAANLFCLIAVLIVGALVFRNGILAHVPSLGGVYNAVGYGSTEKMQLSSLSFSRESDKGTDRYAMKGEIVNHGATTAPTPSIRARLFTKDGEMLKEWVLSSPDILKPGESRAFNAKNLKSAYKTGYMLALEIGSPVELMLRK